MKKKKSSKSSRRDFLQKSLLAGTGVASGSVFYASLLKATELYANSPEAQQVQSRQSLFLSHLRDNVEPLNKKALWAGPLKGGGDTEKYGGIMEEPDAKKKK